MLAADGGDAGHGCEDAGDAGQARDDTVSRRGDMPEEMPSASSNFRRRM